MGSGGSQTVSNTPWGGQAPYLSNQYQQGAGLYQGGVGYNPYPGPTYAGLDPLQKQGMGMIQQAALDPNSAGNASNAAMQKILQGGGYTPSYLAGAMAQNNAGTPGIQNVMNQSWQQQPYASGINQTAQGGYLGGNAALNDVYNTAARKSGEAFSQQT